MGRQQPDVWGVFTADTLQPTVFWGSYLYLFKHIHSNMLHACKQLTTRALYKSSSTESI